jgi:hypothetical protein
MSDTPRTDEATYPADCLGKTLVVNRACAAALERELAAKNAEIARLRESLHDWTGKQEDSKSHITYSLGDAIDATTAYVKGHDQVVRDNGHS